MSTKSLLLIVVLLVGLIVALLLSFRTTTYIGKATFYNTSPITLENSYLFVSPLQAKGDGKELIRVTVFLLDNRGLGVGNQTVELIRPQTLTVVDTQPITDDTGKAVFDVSSTSTGRFELSARTNGKDIPQKARAVFY